MTEPASSDPSGGAARLRSGARHVGMIALTRHAMTGRPKLAGRPVSMQTVSRCDGADHSWDHRAAILGENRRGWVFAAGPASAEGTPVAEEVVPNFGGWWNAGPPTHSSLPYTCYYRSLGRKSYSTTFW